MKSGWVITLAICILAAGCKTTQNPVDQELSEIRLENFPEAKRVDVTVEGLLFTSYWYSDTLEKPFLLPVVAADGVTITRGYPILPGIGESIDHMHHTGFWFAYGNVNGVDFWGNSREIPAAGRSKYGRIRFRNIEKIKSLPGRGILAVNQDWVNPDGTVPIKEKTGFVFYASKDYRIIDRITTLTAQVPEVLFADTKEGAFAIRVAKFLEMPANEPATFADAAGKVTSIAVTREGMANGDYLSSEGIKGASVWSTRAKWMKLSSVTGTDTVSIVFMDHPSNLNYPTFWHARGYGLFSANPFGQRDFTGGKEVLNFKLKKGESITFRHRILIKSGMNCTHGETGKYWKEFSTWNDSL